MRCTARDLIGLGQLGKLDIAYRFAGRAGYLGAFLDALGITLVCIIAKTGRVH